MALNSGKTVALALAQNTLWRNPLSRHVPLTRHWKAACASPIREYVFISLIGDGCRTVRSRFQRLRGFHSVRPLQQRNNQDDESSQPDGNGNKKRKGAKSSAAKSSLRRVALEAERGSRNGTKQERGRSEPDGGHELKDVTAYCATERYDMPLVARHLRDAGFALDPYQTGLYPQVVHIQYPSRSFDAPRFTNGAFQPPGDIFIFPSGGVVAWDVDEFVVNTIILNTLRPAAENPHPDRMETEDLEYYEDPTSQRSSVVDERIRLGTKSPDTHSSTVEDDTHSSQLHQTPSKPTTSTHDNNLALSKIAFSSGLARSTQLAVLESRLDAYFASTRLIPKFLSTGSRLPYSRRFMLRKTGELLSVRAQLNLSGELTDSLPDLFWDSRHELGLEGYFEQVGRALDVGIRIRVLNEKMDYAQEIGGVLRGELEGRHGLKLEWAIVGLICVEVVLELSRVWREERERRGGEGVEGLLGRILERLGGGGDEGGVRG